MSNLIFSLPGKVRQAYAKTCEKVLNEYDLLQVSFDIIMFLANNPEYVTAQEICEVRGIKKNLVSVHVEKLVSLGYLKRSVVAGDKRKIALSCTPKAKDIIRAGREIQLEFFKKITKNIKEEDLVTFQNILKTMLGNLSQD